AQAGEIVEALRETPVNAEKIIKKLTDAAQKSIEAQLKRAAPSDPTTPEQIAQNTRQRDLDTAFNSLTQAGAEVARRLQAPQAEVERAANQQDANEVEECVRDFQDMLTNGFGMDLDEDDEEAQQAARDSASIDRLIAQMQADRKVLEMADKLFS